MKLELGKVAVMDAAAEHDARIRLEQQVKDGAWMEHHGNLIVTKHA